MSPQSWFESLFLALLRASWQASVLIVLVLLLRWLLRKALPPEWRFWFWILVLVRLSLPFSLESPLSIFNYSRLNVPAALREHTAARPESTTQAVLHFPSAASLESAPGAHVSETLAVGSEEAAPRTRVSTKGPWPPCRFFTGSTRWCGWPRAASGQIGSWPATPRLSATWRNTRRGNMATPFFG